MSRFSTVSFARATRSLFAAAALAAFTLQPASAQDTAGDPEAGQVKAYNCMGCHGIPGYHNVYPTYRVPRLGGQHAEYIVAALNGYRAGNRSHPTMTAQASSLSDQDIRDIAAYLSIAPQHDDDVTTVAGGNAARGEEKAAVCASCHGADGVSNIPMNPTLAGQYPDYLQRSLEGYKTGRRNNAIMASFATNLSEQDIKDLAAWFASQDDVEGSLHVPAIE